MASNFERAAYRVRHSLLRRAAGEHAIDALTLVAAFATEWNLNAEETDRLHGVALATIAEIKEHTA